MFRIFDFLSCEQKHRNRSEYCKGTLQLYLPTVFTVMGIGVPTSALIVTGASATKVDNT